MKPNLRSLKKNQEVWALVDEVLDSAEMIVNFGGDLVRVQNQTDRVLRAGQRVLLQVQSVTPLSFRLISRSHRVNFPQQLDVTV